MKATECLRTERSIKKVKMNHPTRVLGLISVSMWQQEMRTEEEEGDGSLELGGVSGITGSDVEARDEDNSV